MLISELAAILLGNMLARKAKIPGRELIRTSEGTIRADKDF